jgi:hypothetical protein
MARRDVDDRVRLLGIAILGEHRLDNERKLLWVVRDGRWHYRQRGLALVVF